jgi:hypothetical protein
VTRFYDHPLSCQDIKLRLAFPTVAIIFACVTSIACAPAGHTSARERVDRELITREQLDQSHFTSAYDAVEALHSNWLRAKGTDSFATPTEVVVYLNANRVGGVDALKNIDVHTVTSIQHFDGLAASARWGVGHGQGVILVNTLLPVPPKPT